MGTKDSVKVLTKQIIFCQGDKKELEEITGEEFEYIKPGEISAAFPENKPTDYSRNTFSTFIEIYRRDVNLRILKREMYKEAEKMNAEAVIHYKANLFNRGDSTLYGLATGTPVRKKMKG